MVVQHIHTRARTHTQPGNGETHTHGAHTLTGAHTHAQYMHNKCNLFGLTSAHTFAVKAHKRVAATEGTELRQAE